MKQYFKRGTLRARSGLYLWQMPFNRDMQRTLRASSSLYLSRVRFTRVRRHFEKSRGRWPIPESGFYWCPLCNGGDPMVEHYEPYTQYMAELEARQFPFA